MSDPQTQEEAEVLADEQAAPAELAPEKQEPAKTEYLEFLGTNPEFGTEFYGDTGTHVITAKHLREAADVELGVKEAVWKRGRNGRFLVPTSDLTPEAVDHLSHDAMFKVVSL